MQRFSKRNRTVNINTTTDIDVDINLDEIISEIDDKDIIEEFQKRKLGSSEQRQNFELSRRSICDHFGVSYYETSDKLVEMVRSIL